MNDILNIPSKDCPKVLIDVDYNINKDYFQDLLKHPERLFLTSEDECDGVIGQIIKDCGWTNDLLRLQKKSVKKNS